MEYSYQLFTQLLLETMARHGAHVTFDYPPALDKSFLQELSRRSVSQERQALAAIAGALRQDSDDFTCIDEIIRILEPLGYTTVPRHDFG